MVNYKKLLKRIEKEKENIKKEKKFLPTTLSSTEKKNEIRNLNMNLYELSKEQKELKKKQEKQKKVAGYIKETLSKKVKKPKKVFKKQGQVTYKMPSRKIESTWEDPNRFFKGEMEDAKTSMFFS